MFCFVFLSFIPALFSVLPELHCHNKLFGHWVQGRLRLRCTYSEDGWEYTPKKMWLIHIIWIIVISVYRNLEKLLQINQFYTQSLIFRLAKEEVHFRSWKGNSGSFRIQVVSVFSRWILHSFSLGAAPKPYVGSKNPDMFSLKVIV